MISVAIYKDFCLTDGVVADEIARISNLCECGSASIVEFQSAIDLADKAASSQAELIDLAFVPYELPGMDGLSVATEAKAASPTLRTVLVCADASHAAGAAEAGIDGYLIEPVTRADFERVTKFLLSQVARLHAESFVTNTRNGMQRIPFVDVLYCETSGHDQVVHLRNGSQAVVRSSSQKFFELLTPDPRFFKAGSSNIVNLDETVELRTTNGLAELADGTVLSIPARLRKSFEESLISRAP